MRFADRPASTSWESVPLTGAHGCYLWIWFKPPLVPHGMLINIPNETFRDPSRSTALNMRNLLRSVGLVPHDLVQWTYLGRHIVPQDETDPQFNQPFTEPPAPLDRAITLVIKSSPEVASSVPAVGPAVNLVPASNEVIPVFARMEFEWNACLQLESQLEDTARSLTSMMGRVSSMNRDLSFDEARFSDQGDRNEWTEVRRWLREAISRLSRYLREQQVSVQIANPGRQACERIYQNYVVPRQHFDNIEQADRDFEAHRRSLQTLMNNMKAAQQYASEEALKRAQRVLTRISGKVRAAQTKRGG